ncbi:hypothetical protein [Spongiactinospora sp. 9N601]|uniref:hypothetical protein n=1 Tax=Spongiactinospora sp. 9N601 TaxID=3375149 RepID=UPI003798B32A
MDIAHPGDVSPNAQTWSTPVHVAGKDNGYRDFPCLSHCSFQLEQGQILHAPRSSRRLIQVGAWMELLWRARRRNTLISWPHAVDDRLERLVAAGLASGENVSRSQVLAALVANTEVSPERVAALVQAYRRMSADALDSALDPVAEDWPKVWHPGPCRHADRPSADE